MISYKRILAWTLLAGTFFALPSPVLSVGNGQFKYSMTSLQAGVHAAVIEVGPIDIHRRYLSMQGPLAVESFSIDQLVSQPKTIVPESRIKYMEDGGAGSTMGGGTSCKLKDDVTRFSNANLQSRQLYWYKGVKVEVLDEKNQVMPTQEFMCHVCLILDPSRHNKLFPYGSSINFSGNRLANVTQGQSSIILPDGFGLPLASDERIDLGLQAANRGTDQHRRIKIRCILYFIRDRDLVKSMQALSIRATSITVVVRKETPAAVDSECNACVATSMGQDAPNDLNKMFMHKSPSGNVYTAHWIVPPGIHTYREAITEEVSPGFALNGSIRAAQIHVHPYCSSFSLLEFRNKHEHKMFTSHCVTQSSPILEITHIDPMNSPQGIQLHKDAQYAQEVIYNNTSGKPIDAMATSVIFFSDPGFKKPSWASVNTKPTSSKCTFRNSAHRDS